MWSYINWEWLNELRDKKAEIKIFRYEYGVEKYVSLENATRENVGNIIKQLASDQPTTSS